MFWEKCWSWVAPQDGDFPSLSPPEKGAFWHLKERKLHLIPQVGVSPTFTLRSTLPKSTGAFLFHAALASPFKKFLSQICPLHLPRVKSSSNKQTRLCRKHFGHQARQWTKKRSDRPSMSHSLWRNWTKNCLNGKKCLILSSQSVLR